MSFLDDNDYVLFKLKEAEKRILVQTVEKPFCVQCGGAPSWVVRARTYKCDCPYCANDPRTSSEEALLSCDWHLLTAVQRLSGDKGIVDVTALK